MTSAVRHDPQALAKAISVRELVHSQTRVLRAAMTDRQRELNRRYQFHRSQQYDNRSTNWRGNKILSLLDLEEHAARGTLPPGYYDPTRRLDDLPYELRRPATQYPLTRLIVNRFTDLLFGSGHHPALAVPDSPDTQDWIEGLVESSRYWQRWGQARDLGGAMGSVAVGFKFVAGKPVIEVQDPRWCTPYVRDRSTWDLDGLEIKFMYAQPTRVIDRDTGKPVTVSLWYWYRRVIDLQADTTFQPELVDPEVDPVWKVDPARTFAHGLPFVPWRWVQNLPNDEIDGIPDCEGIWDNVEMLDGLMSQSAIGARSNCDPTLHIATSDQNLDGIRKGSGNALRTEKDGNASYLEMTGAGIKSALEVRKEIRAESLEAAQCVLDEHNGGGALTATEIRFRYQSMHNRAERLREQYGEMGAKPLIEMQLEATRLYAGKAIANPENTTITTFYIKLPPLIRDGSLTDRTIGEGKFLQFSWPDLVKPTTADAQASAQAVATARSARALDQESAVRYLAKAFELDDVPEVLRRLRTEQAEVDASLASELLAGSGIQLDAPPAPAPAADAPPAPAPASAPAPDQAGPLDAITVNEITLGIERLGKLGDVATLNILRRALAVKLGVPYTGDVDATQLAGNAAPVAAATDTGTPPGAPPPSSPPAPGAPPAPPAAG